MKLLLFGVAEIAGGIACAFYAALASINAQPGADAAMWDTVFTLGMVLMALGMLSVLFAGYVRLGHGR